MRWTKPKEITKDYVEDHRDYSPAITVKPTTEETNYERIPFPVVRTPTDIQPACPGTYWLSGLPSEPGWYWFRSLRKAREHPNDSLGLPLEVFESNGELVTSNGLRRVDSYAGQWSGPLPQPKD